MEMTILAARAYLISVPTSRVPVHKKGLALFTYKSRGTPGNHKLGEQEEMPDATSPSPALQMKNEFLAQGHIRREE